MIDRPAEMPIDERLSQGRKVSGFQRIMCLAAFAVLALACARTLSTEPFGILVGGPDMLAIQDFASHWTFVRAFWLNDAGYDVASHLRVARNWCGQDIDKALPFGYSPTMLIVLLPLIALPARWAYLAWTAVGASGAWAISRSSGLSGSLVLLSPIAILCWSLGQTAFVSLMAIVAMSWLVAARHGSSWRGVPNTLLVGGLLWLTTAKPPIAIACGLTLVMLRQWKALAVGMGLTAVCFAALTPKLGSEWPRQYLEMISKYNRVHADHAFEWSLVPETMTNLRAVLSVTCCVADDLSARVSSLAWAGVMLGVWLCSIIRRVDVSGTFGLSMLAYLLFCPHLTSTEDLHLLALLVWLSWPSSSDAPGQQPLDASLLRTIKVLIPLLLFLAPGAGPMRSYPQLPIAFLGKLALFVLWARLFVRPKTGTQTKESGTAK